MYLYTDENFDYYHEKGVTFRVNFLTDEMEEVEPATKQQLTNALDLRSQGY